MHLAMMRAAREIKPRHRHDGKRDSQLKRGDIMAIVKKGWEEAFSPDVCAHSWQRIGVHPFTRRPYWELREQEEIRAQRQQTSVAQIARRQLHQEAAGALRAADTADAFLEVSSSDEELPQKRINNSSNWWAKGIITQGAA